jgi:hypothetical protein
MGLRKKWPDFENVYSMKLVSQEGMYSVDIDPMRLKLSGEVVGELG